MNETDKKEHFNRIAPVFDQWKSRNGYYHEQIKRFYSSVIPKGKRVLEIGCATGDLLACVDPEYGLGIDISDTMVEIAREKYPQLNFAVADIDTLSAGQGFDYIILSNLLEYIHDCWDFFRKLKKFMSKDTKIVIIAVNPLWEPLMYLGAALRIKTPDVQRNYITKKDLITMLLLCDCDIVEDGFRVIFPLKLFFISDFINKLFFRIPVINNLCCTQYIIFRDKPKLSCAEDLSCSVIVPCFNEAGNIRKCIERIPQMGTFTQIIVVDDGSTDGTADAVKELMEKRKDVSVLAHPFNQGKAVAIKTGFEHARGDIVIILDADMSVPPEELPRFFYAIAEGKAEFVNGTRMVYPMEKGAMRFVNFLGNKMFGILLSLLSGQRNTDTLCGTKALMRKYCRYITIHSAWGDFDLLFAAAKLKLKTVEMPVHYKKRATGYSKMKAVKESLSLLKICWRWFNEL
jgi:SAM-dependent methyltransferase/CTP:molybdopterin cytidylyltransferase MocA